MKHILNRWRSGFSAAGVDFSVVFPEALQGVAVSRTAMKCSDGPAKLMEVVDRSWLCDEAALTTGSFETDLLERHEQQSMFTSGSSALIDDHETSTNIICLH